MAQKPDLYDEILGGGDADTGPDIYDQILSPTAGEAIVAGAKNVARGAMSATSSLLFETGPNLKELITGEPADDTLGRALSGGVARATEAMRTPNVEQMGGVGGFFANDVAQGLGSIAPAVAGGVVGRLAKIPTMLSTGATGGLLGANEQYRDALDHGVEGGSATAMGAWVAGLGGGMTEALALGPILSKWNVKTGGKLGALLLATGEEGGQEALQRFISNETANLLDYDDRPALEGLLRDGAAGGAVGFLIQAMLGGGQHARGPKGEAPIASGEQPAPVAPGAPTAPFLDDEAPATEPPPAPGSTDVAPPAEQPSGNSGELDLTGGAGTFAEQEAQTPGARQISKLQVRLGDLTSRLGEMDVSMRDPNLTGAQKNYIAKQKLVLMERQKSLVMELNVLVAQEAHAAKQASMQVEQEDEAVDAVPSAPGQVTPSPDAPEADAVAPPATPTVTPTKPKKGSRKPKAAPAPETTVKLPEELSKAAPRYGYGSRNFELQFKSDIDRALYITAQAKKSKRDADFRAFLKAQGLSDKEIVAGGERVRERVKALAKNAPKTAKALALEPEALPNKGRKKGTKGVKYRQDTQDIADEKIDSVELGRPLTPAFDEGDHLTHAEMPDVMRMTEPADSMLGGNSAESVAENIGSVIPEEVAQEEDPGSFIVPEGQEPISEYRQGERSVPDLYGSKEPTIEQRRSRVFGLFGGPVQRTEIMKSIGKILDVAGGKSEIKVGYVMKGAMGVFKTKEAVARIVNAGDISTATHEMAHNLEQLVFGRSKGGPWKSPTIGSAMERELLRIGKIAYKGHSAPAGGYKREGFAEFVRLFLTSPETVQKEAPQFYNWFQNEFLMRDHPDIGAAFDSTKDLITTYRKQGSFARAQQGIVDVQSLRYRIAQSLGIPISKRLDSVVRTWFEMGDALWTFSDRAREAMAAQGVKMKASQDPSALYEASRLTAPAIADTMVNTNTVDLAGNVTGKSLDDVLAPVQGQMQDWLVWMYARRAVALWSDPLRPAGRDPGLSHMDAQHILDTRTTPAFEIAASEFDAWWNRVLDMVGQHSPWIRDTIAKIKASDPGSYFPLKRVIDSYDAIVRQQPGAKGASLGSRLRGSGRPVKTMLNEIVGMTQTFIAGAQRRRILDAIIEAAKYPDMGGLAENVTAQISKRGPVQFDVAQVMKALHDAGAIESEVAAEDFAEDVITLFAPIHDPRYKGTIIPIRFGAEIQYWHVFPELYDTLQGLDLYRLPKGLKWLGGMKRMVSLGATALSPRWGLVFNPLVDFQTLWLNTQTQAGFPKMLTTWVGNLMHAALHNLSSGRYSTAELDTVYNLGLHIAPLLMSDADQAAKAVKRLDTPRSLRWTTVSSAFDFLKAMLSFPETAARATEIGILAKERGYNLKKLTPDQAIELAQAYKQVTIDFTAAGSMARTINSFAPFFNVPFQSARASLRSAQRNPGRFAMRGLFMTTIPALLAWWKFKDDDKWKEQSARDKFAFIPIPNPLSPENPMRLRYGSESQYIFGGMMVALFDAAYRQDPESITDFMGVFAEATIPNPMPVPATLAAEQLGNRQLHSGSPIETRDMQRRDPIERRNEYTSKAAIFLAGRAVELGLPEWMQSPRRLDAMMNGAFPAVDQIPFWQAKEIKRENELADTAVFGALFKHGGMRGTNPQPIRDVYAALEVATRNQASLEREETPEQKRIRLYLDDAARAISMLTWMRSHTSSSALRRELTETATQTAKEALAAVGLPESVDRGRMHGAAERSEGFKKLMESDLKDANLPPAGQDARARRLLELMGPR